MGVRDPSHSRISQASAKHKSVFTFCTMTRPGCSDTTFPRVESLRTQIKSAHKTSSIQNVIKYQDGQSYKNENPPCCFSIYWRTRLYVLLIENVTKMLFESHPKEGTTTQFPHVFDTESEGGGQGSQEFKFHQYTCYFKSLKSILSKTGKTVHVPNAFERNVSEVTEVTPSQTCVSYISDCLHLTPS